jgi:hypothetical protein
LRRPDLLRRKIGLGMGWDNGFGCVGSVKVHDTRGPVGA